MKAAAKPQHTEKGTVAYGEKNGRLQRREPHLSEMNGQVRFVFCIELRIFATALKL